MTDDKSKKQLLLRLSPTLYESVSRMAADDFRSVNGEIEYLLNMCAVKRGLMRMGEPVMPTDALGADEPHSQK